MKILTTRVPYST